MTDIIVSGCNGYMGRVIEGIVKDDPEFTIVAGFDVNTETRGGFPVYTDPIDFTGDADVVVDFSNPSALSGLLKFSVASKIPLVLCTTGYSADDLAAIEIASGQIPVFRSGNMSLGINLLIDLVKRACAVLGEAYDVEIVERHHRRKLDAPSGTALMLADAAASALQGDSEYVFERRSRSVPRESCEIGISSVRGGTVVGQHEVIFAGLDEVIELRHTASSRDVFAVGALRAAAFMAGVIAPGLYEMKDMLASGQ